MKLLKSVFLRSAVVLSVLGFALPAYADNEDANEMLVAAAMKHLEARTTEDYAKKVSLFRSAMNDVDKILMEYPETDVASRIMSGVPIMHGMSYLDLRQHLHNSEITDKVFWEVMAKQEPYGDISRDVAMQYIAAFGENADFFGDLKLKVFEARPKLTKLYNCYMYGVVGIEAYKFMIAGAYDIEYREIEVMKTFGDQSDMIYKSFRYGVKDASVSLFDELCSSPQALVLTKDLSQFKFN